VTAQVVPVGILAAYVRDLLEQDAVLSDIWVEGEVSNVFNARSGHLYFTLKDLDSQLKCVMFKAQVARQRSLPESGQQTAVHGAISLYAKDGAIQLYADVIQPAGIGLLALEFEHLRQRLEADGLFDPARKRPLPERPKTIGVVTSPDGAVWHDIQTVLRRRYPFVEAILAPATVQGDAAPEAIASALYDLQDIDRVEVIILARGGGSAEDLAAFNDEYVARTVFACRVPVVTGVGHDTDWTIVDWVADVRAPTPSVAAELCVPDVAEIRLRLEEARTRLDLEIGRELNDAADRVVALRHRLARTDPRGRAAAERRRVADLRRRLDRRQQEFIRGHRAGLLAQVALLRALEPNSVLNRGYAVVYDNATRRPITSTAGLHPGDAISARLASGTLSATVTDASG
jgi:exodeoxyribonuclease VII large subunit